MKSIFKSKTAALGFITTLTGALGYFLPEVQEFVASNSNLILIGVGAVSVALRRITNGKVTLFPSKD